VQRLELDGSEKESSSGKITWKGLLTFSVSYGIKNLARG
jgi:hypothetical protein